MDTDCDPGAQDGSAFASLSAAPGHPAPSARPREPQTQAPHAPPAQPPTHPARSAETYTIDELKTLLSLQAEWQMATLERDAAADRVQRARRDGDRAQQPLDKPSVPSSGGFNPEYGDTDSQTSPALDASGVAASTEYADDRERDSACTRPRRADIRWKQYVARRADGLSSASRSHLAFLQSKVASRRADLAARRERLARARHKVLTLGVEQEAGKYRAAVQAQKLKLQRIDVQIHLRRQELVQKLDEVYPIAPVDATALLFSIHGILLPVPAAPSDTDPHPPAVSRTSTDPNDLRQLLARAYDPNSMASGLALVVQLVTLLSLYLGIPLHYDVAQAGSWGVIHDDISPYLGPRVFPLYLEGEHERYRFDYAVFLLEKNVENLLRKLGMSVLDLHAILPNLKNLTVTYTSDTSHSASDTGHRLARSARTRIDLPSSLNGSPLSSAAASRRSSWVGSSIRVLPPGRTETLPSFSLKLPSSPTHPSRLGSHTPPSPASGPRATPPRHPDQGAAHSNGYPARASTSYNPHVKVRAFAPTTGPGHASNLGAGGIPHTATAKPSSSPADKKDSGHENLSRSMSPSPASRPALKPASSFSSWLPWRATLSTAPSAAAGSAKDPVPVFRTLGKS